MLKENKCYIFRDAPLPLVKIAVIGKILCLGSRIKIYGQLCVCLFSILEHPVIGDDNVRVISWCLIIGEGKVWVNWLCLIKKYINTLDKKSVITLFETIQIEWKKLFWVKKYCDYY